MVKTLIISCILLSVPRRDLIDCKSSWHDRVIKWLRSGHGRVSCTLSVSCDVTTSPGLPGQTNARVEIRCSAQDGKCRCLSCCCSLFWSKNSKSKRETQLNSRLWLNAHNLHNNCPKKFPWRLKYKMGWWKIFTQKKISDGANPGPHFFALEPHFSYIEQV